MIFGTLSEKMDNLSIGTEYAMREKQYVRVDEHGVMRIGTTRVMLDALVAGFEQGHARLKRSNNNFQH